MKIEKEIVVETSQARAFRVFTDGIDRWWPRDHHIGASPLRHVILEPKVGGRWYSVHEDGSQTDTGRVLAWEPPGRVLLTWQVTAQWKFDADFTTEVEIVFHKLGEQRTRVTLEHRQLERYGVKADEMFAMLQGWQSHLERLAEAANSPDAVNDVMSSAP